MEKSKGEAFQVKIKTLSSKMKNMIEDQNKIEKNLAAIENDMRTAVEERKKKLQESNGDIIEKPFDFHRYFKQTGCYNPWTNHKVKQY